MTPRLLTASAVALALGLGAAACGTVSPNAATVNGTNVKRSDFDTELRAWTDNQPLQDFLKTAAPQLATKTGTKGTVSGDLARFLLQLRIRDGAIHSDLATKKLLPTADDVAAAKPDAIKQFSNPSATNGDTAGDTVFNAFTKDEQQVWINRVADNAAFRKSVSTEPTDADLQKLYDASADTLANVCASHILVATEAEANTVEGRLKAGEAFADVAKAVSTDKGSGAQGGKLYTGDTCTPASGYVPEFAAAVVAATVGTPTAPVKTQFGYHVILLDKPVQKETFEEAKTALLQTAQQTGDKAAQTALGAAIKGAKVTVDPRYGTWDGSKIVAPASESATSTTTGTGATTAAATTTVAPKN